VRLLIYSHAPWARSGYGNITLGLSTRLKAVGWEVAVVAIDHQNSPITFQGIPVYPCMSHITKSSNDLYYHTSNLKPDLILQLFDAWVIDEPWIRSSIPVVTYNPVDCSPVATTMPAALQGATLNLAMSPHTVKEFTKSGIAPYKYLPHSIDTTAFQALPKEEARAAFGISKDAFVVGLVGTNLTARKNLPGQLLAFSKFLSANPEANAYLFLHTYMKETLDSSFDLLTYINQLGLVGRVKLVDQNDYMLKLLDESYMQYYYSTLDVLLECSLGEGFGIPILEAQACNVPVITTNFSAMPYTTGLGGLIVRHGLPVAAPDSNSWQFLPSPKAIALKLEMLYNRPELRSKLSVAARENSEAYDWNVWMPVWERTLKNVCGM
jgi:glycosyltransferase involved in cell wall biosynthesis